MRRIAHGLLRHRKPCGPEDGKQALRRMLECSNSSNGITRCMLPLGTGKELSAFVVYSCSQSCERRLFFAALGHGDLNQKRVAFVALPLIFILVPGAFEASFDEDTMAAPNFAHQRDDPAIGRSRRGFCCEDFVFLKLFFSALQICTQVCGDRTITRVKCVSRLKDVEIVTRLSGQPGICLGNCLLISVSRSRHDHGRTRDGSYPGVERGNCLGEFASSKRNVTFGELLSCLGFDRSRCFGVSNTRSCKTGRGKEPFKHARFLGREFSVRLPGLCMSETGQNGQCAGECDRLDTCANPCPSDSLHGCHRQPGTNMPLMRIVLSSNSVEAFRLSIAVP